LKDLGTDENDRAISAKANLSSSIFVSQHRSEKPHNSLITLVCHWVKVDDGENGYRDKVDIFFDRT